MNSILTKEFNVAFSNQLPNKRAAATVIIPASVFPFGTINKILFSVYGSVNVFSNSNPFGSDVDCQTSKPEILGKIDLPNSGVLPFAFNKEIIVNQTLRIVEMRVSLRIEFYTGELPVDNIVYTDPYRLIMSIEYKE
jgi:hypothetical protein